MKILRTLVCLILMLTMSLSFLSVYAKTPDEVPEPAESSWKVYSKSFDENGLWSGIRALDYVEIFKYKSFVVPSEVHWVSDEVLQASIYDMLAEFPSTAYIMDRAVADGDTVNIDFVGSIDGEEFDGGSTGGMGTDVTIGVTDYIDDFLLKLIGHKPDETVNVKVKFPDNYFSEELSGKEAVFVTKINYILDTDPESIMTDAFVLKNLYSQYGWSTVDEFTTGLHLQLQRQSIDRYLADYFTTNVTVRSVPKLLTDFQELDMLKYYQDYADYYGVELIDLLYNEGLAGIDELIEAYSEYNLKNATYYLVGQAIAEDAGFTVSTEDLENYHTKYYGTSDYSAQVAQYGLPYVKHLALFQKVLDYIVKNADLQVGVVLNGQLLNFDVQPQIINGRTLVPLRVIFEEMGATVDWEGSTQTVTVTKDDTKVVLRIGSTSPTVNGKVVAIDQPGIVTKGRTLVPIRFIAEALGVTVNWSGAFKTVTITS